MGKRYMEEKYKQAIELMMEKMGFRWCDMHERWEDCDDPFVNFSDCRK